jgi:hypothetical protein
MDLVSGAKRVVVAMQHTANRKPKIVKEYSLPLASLRQVDLVVNELAVIAFPLVETGPNVIAEDVVAATEAEPPERPAYESLKSDGLAESWVSPSSVLRCDPHSLCAAAYIRIKSHERVPYAP